MAIRSDPSTWTDPRHRRGVEGERIAKTFLQLRGWTILEHRFRLGRWEVDLIARRRGVIAFVEVKTRSSHQLGSPVDAVTWAKKREVARVARGWVDRFGGPAWTYRFDVIGVTMTAEGPLVQHVESAFWVGWR